MTTASKIADKHWIEQAIRLRDTDALIDVVSRQRDEIAALKKRLDCAPAIKRTVTATIAPEAIAEDWRKRKIVAQMITQTCGKGWSFAAWQGSDGERRVYLDGPDIEPGLGNKPRAIFYVTGSHQHAPKYMCVFGEYYNKPAPHYYNDPTGAKSAGRKLLWSFKGLEKEIKYICDHISQQWVILQSCTCYSALNSDGAACNTPEAYQMLRGIRDDEKTEAA